MKKADADIFLCHSSKDKEFVGKLANDLHDLSINAWFDAWELEPGDSLFDCIGKALEKSVYVGVIISSNSVNSNWCKKELNQALSREIRDGRKIIIPIKLDDVNMPAFLEEKVYLNFSESYFKAISKLSCMIHVFDLKELNIALEKSSPQSIHDIKMLFLSLGDDVEKLKGEDGQYIRSRKMAKMQPTTDNLLHFGRICFALNKDEEAKEVFHLILSYDSDFTSFSEIDQNVRKLAREKKTFKMKPSTRIAMSYLGLIDNDEDLVLNSAYDSEEKEPLVNAGKFYLKDIYTADVPTSIAYFIKATRNEPANSGWVMHCDEFIHRALTEKKVLYPKFSWDYIEKCVQEWHNHRWKLV